MTFSIVARCERTGYLGVASATFSLACGARSEGARPGVAVSRTQAFPKRTNCPLALNLVALGFRPAEAIALVEENDPDFEYRQMAIIAPTGPVAMHTGAKARRWAGHRTGEHFAAFGNILAGPQVIEGMVAGFESDPGVDLGERLLRAIEGGRDAGGQIGLQGHVTERSAWVRVVDDAYAPRIDLRVDWHDSAVHELRRIHSALLRERADAGA